MKEMLYINDCLTSFAHDQFVAKCSVSAAERGGVSKILLTRADCKIFSAEAMDKQATVSGKVTFKIIYLDREGKPQGLDYFCDINEKIEGEEITSAISLLPVCSVVDVTSELSGEDIELSAVCDIELNGVRKTEIKCLDLEGEYVVKTKTQDLIRVNRLPDVTFELTEETSAESKVDKVLLFDASATVTEVSENGSASGYAAADIIYVDDGNVKSKRIILPFTEEIEAGAKDVTATIKNSRLVLMGEDETVFNVELLVTLRGHSLSSESVETQADAFSLTKELTCDYGKLPCRKFAKEYKLETPVSVSADQDELPEGSKISAYAPGRVTIANLIPSDDTATVEGLAVANVLYTIDGGVKAVQIDLPFSVSLSAEGMEADDHLSAEAAISNLTVGLAANVLKITAVLDVRVKDYKTYNLEWIASCEEGEEKALSPYGFSVYFASKNRDKWDVAKELNVDPEDLEANDDDKLVVFRKRKD